MTVRAHAAKTMFNKIARESFERARTWFQEHPDEPYCYWAKDDFIAIKDKANQEILKAHPEIEDINDHTIVEFDSQNDVMYLGKFCPKLKQAIADLYDTGFDHYCTVDGMKWFIAPKDDNFRMTVYED